MTNTSQAFSANYFTTIVHNLEHVREILPQIAQASKIVATRLVNGGRLFAASVRPDFTSEAYVRSGGLMLLEEYTPTTQLTAVDTVLVGWSNTNPTAEMTLIHQLHQANAYLVGFGPKPPTATSDVFLNTLDVFIESNPVLPAALLTNFGAATYPLTSLQNIVILWTFTGELVAALTRQQTMPTLYQSVLVTGARSRNEQRHHLRFEEYHNVPPLAPEYLGHAYLDRLGDCFQKLITNEINTIDQIAHECSSTLQQGHQIHAFLISHFPVLQHGAPGDPGFMQRLSQVHGETPSTAELELLLKAHDLLFFLGYYRRPNAAYTIAHKAGARIIECITGTHIADPPNPDFIIHPHWPYGDALVSIPGYDIDILPCSGIIQTAIYWALIGTVTSIHQSLDV